MLRSKPTDAYSNKVGDLPDSTSAIQEVVHVPNADRLARVEAVLHTSQGHEAVLHTSKEHHCFRTVRLIKSTCPALIYIETQLWSLQIKSTSIALLSL